MRKHQDCDKECQCPSKDGCEPQCRWSCEDCGCDCYLLELEEQRNMTPRERAGWIRAMDEGVD